MYEAFYGLTSKPFQLNPDPGFYFSSKQHQRARAYLEYGAPLKTHDFRADDARNRARV